MDGTMDKKSQKMLLESLGRMKEDQYKMLLKEDAKVWASIAVPFQLADFLQTKTREELYHVGKRLRFEKLSTLKKQQLVDRLTSYIPESIKNIWRGLEEDHYNIMMRLADRGGHLSVHNLNMEHVNYLKQLGIVSTGTVDGTRSVVMAQEVVQAVKKFHHKEIGPLVQLNSQSIRLMRGLLYYYGYVSLKDMEILLEKYLGNRVNIWSTLEVVLEALDEDDDIQFDQTGFSYFWVMDLEELKQEHAMRPTLEYYPFTKQQLLIAGEPEYVERNMSYIGMVDYLCSNYDITKEEADAIVEECAKDINNGKTPGELLGLLQNQFEFDTTAQAEKFVDKLTQFYSNSKQWFLKGHSPNEMPNRRKTSNAPQTQQGDVISFSTGQKVGRNDPCPCGSGKKFKKCCGA